MPVWFNLGNGFRKKKETRDERLKRTWDELVKRSNKSK